MKKKIFAVLVIMLLVLSLVACSKDNGNGNGDEAFKIEPLANLTDYGADAKYYIVTPINYGNVDAQIAELNRAINDEKDEYAQEEGETEEAWLERTKDRSTASKIFENATPEGIIEALSKAALPKPKMIDTVAYLAGEEDKGSEYNSKTSSFIDDIDELDRLKDIVDDATGDDKNDAKDNVARQERIIMGKVFDIGMSGDEFARVVTEGMVYIQAVLNGKMIPDYNEANESEPALDRNAYCKEVLKDYGFLVYIMSFNDIYYAGDGNSVATNNGKRDCVRLYSYYHDYNKNAYDVLPQADFELQLKYSHQDIYTDTEWSDYLRIQKRNYLESYRYTASMYKSINQAQNAFKAKQEKNDVEVYGGEVTDLNKDGTFGTTYSKAAQKAQAYLENQMEMTDLLFYYADDGNGGDSAKIMEYNRANTAYQNALKANNDDKDKPGVAIPRLKFEYAQLEIADYLLNNMSNTALTGVLTFQIFSYSADSCEKVQSKRKEMVLYREGIKEPSSDTVDSYSNQEPDPNPFETSFSYDTPQDEAYGRVRAIELNLEANYSQAEVDKTQLPKAKQAAWDKIRVEVKDTLEQEYNYNANLTDAPKELEKFEDTLIKKNYDYDGETKLSTWSYDTSHETSRLLDTHKSVFRYATNTIEVSYKSLKKDNDNAHGFKDSNIDAADLGEQLPGKIVLAATKAGNTLTFNAAAFEKIEYNRGKDETPTDTDLVQNPGNIQLVVTVKEGSSGSSQVSYEYEFEFDGNYLDKDLKYKFIQGTELECDLALYVGYKVTKTKVV